MARLKIHARPLEHQLRVVRAPVPWKGAWQAAREAQSLQLFTTSRVTRDLQQLWDNKWAGRGWGEGRGGGGWEGGRGKEEVYRRKREGEKPVFLHLKYIYTCIRTRELTATALYEKIKKPGKKKNYNKKKEENYVAGIGDTWLTLLWTEPNYYIENISTKIIYI